MQNNIILLYGDNPFEIEAKLKQWKAGFIEKYGGEMNVDEMSGSTEAHTILESAYSIPFLSEKRLLIVKGFLETQKTEALKSIAEQLGKIPETCVLIFIEQKMPDKRTTLFKKLQKIARLEEIKSLSGEALIQWILERVSKKQSKMDSKTAFHLMSTAGNDLWRLEHEIEKLIPYAEGQTITMEMVDELVSDGNISTSIFKLTDALGTKKIEEALKILHRLVNQGEELPMIFSMLVRQFRLILQIQELKALHHSPHEIATRLKQHPYAVSSILPQCKHFTPNELKRIFEKLLNIDRGLKTGVFRYQPSDQKEYLLQIEKLMIECAMSSPTG